MSITGTTTSREGNQILIPDSFAAIYMEHRAGLGARPSADPDFIAARHELCEDMATALSETASAKLHEHHLAHDIVQHRIYQGLCRDNAPLSPAEARWTIQRLSELLSWPQPPAYLFGDDEDQGN